MGLYLLDCDGQRQPSDPTCTLTHYTMPPATVTVDHYQFAPGWLAFPVAIVILAVVIGIGTVRYKAHEERGQTERERIANPPKTCQTCGDKVGG